MSEGTVEAELVLGAWEVELEYNKGRPVSALLEDQLPHEPDHISLGHVRSNESEQALPWTRYAASAAGLSTLLLAIGGYTLLLAAGARRRGTAAARALGVTIALFWVDVMADLWDPLQYIDWLSPFRYFRPIPSAVVPYTPLENPLALLGIFVVCTALAFYRFQRQDL